MLCFRDRTYFNHGTGCTCSPGRRLTPEVEAAARRWWESGGGNGDDTPIATTDLCGKDGNDE